MTSRAADINLHALIGILLWLLLLARLGYRLRHSPPAFSPKMGAFSRRFSSPVHVALYALLFITPIIGFVTFVYHGRILTSCCVTVSCRACGHTSAVHDKEVPSAAPMP